MIKRAVLGLGSGVGVVATLVATACTEDFTQFQFTGEGGQGATTVGVGGAPATTTGGTTTTSTGNTTSNTTGATTTGATTTSTTAATTTAATTTTGGGPIDIPCGTGGTCDVDASEHCCIAKAGSANGTCATSSCNGSQAQLECNEPADCPGELCCIDKPSDFVDSACDPACDGGDDIQACSGNGTACMKADGGSGVCSQISGLPTGYLGCQ